MKIGRYRIAFASRTFVPHWMRTETPTTVRRFLCFWVFKESRPRDVDRKQQFPTGMPMEYKGRRYRYRHAGKSVDKDELVREKEYEERVRRSW